VTERGSGAEEEMYIEGKGMKEWAHFRGKQKGVTGCNVKKSRRGGGVPKRRGG